MNLSQLLTQMRTSQELGERITAWKLTSPTEGSFADFPPSVDPRLVNVLRSRGVKELFTHQAMAIDAAQRGQNLIVVTPTASGKTLCYNIPVLNSLLEDPHSRAIYLFPTKALSQDQLDELHGLITALNVDIKTYTYDGDTPVNARKAIRAAGHIVITNPDMLHTGILPHHTKWVKLFENLKYVVIDEVHQYRGVFGSHLANVIRRLKRICDWYGTKPIFILSSATIANPDELARKLKQIYMLRRILYCEECGRSMRVETRYYRRKAKDGSGMERVPTTRAYRCRSFSSWPGSFDRCKPLSYVNAERIESLVWNELVELLRSPQMMNGGISGQLATLEESVNEAKSRAALLRKKLGGLERERHTVITWARTGRITEEDLTSQLLDLDERQKAFQEDYERAMETASMKADELDTQRFAVEFCRHVSGKLDYLSSDPLTPAKLAERQELARMLLHRVWISSKGEVRIEGRIPKLEEDSVFEYALPG